MMASALDPSRIYPTRPVDAVPAECRSTKARRVILLQVIPTRPPCFADDEAWQRYVLAADAEGRRFSPLIFVAGKPAFNRSLNHCQDCQPLHAVAMDRAKRCFPDWLRKPVQPQRSE
jgi:hypothetical protein